MPRIETTLDRVTKTNEELAESNRILTGNMASQLGDLNNKVDELIKGGIRIE